ncbi:hypothetical protein DVA67_001930 [Solirubrobacter sp. CPCC 204708]|uniref:Uncharacterized protein n=1 Tax=Solirubrobacter deserti TaxID=2282478 RepID=A0ABT4RR33_9ACTN|nr:hypothetical protein [Solirubrobacter deserti]MBE2314717.1 hypothetical protein [Solirubrobacter deserti]MDA0141034.1 hypothetical protein [Solirubrobacter deserti]
MIQPEIIRWPFARPEEHVAVTCLTVREPCQPSVPIVLPPVVRRPKPVRPKPAS